MSKEEMLEMSGMVREVLPDSRYRVTLDNYQGGARRPALFCLFEPARRIMKRSKKNNQVNDMSEEYDFPGGVRVHKHWIPGQARNDN